MIAPLFCEWNGEALVPRRHFRKTCDESLVIGECYRIEFVEERSAKSMAFYFARLDEIYDSLPETEDRFDSREHMRHFALIRNGFCTRDDVLCASNENALHLAALANRLDFYVLTRVTGDVVTVWRAQSQAMRAMGKETFRNSMDAVLEYCESLVGIEPQKEPS